MFGCAVFVNPEMQSVVTSKKQLSRIETKKQCVGVGVVLLGVPKGSFLPKLTILKKEKIPLPLHEIPRWYEKNRGKLL